MLNTDDELLKMQKFTLKLKSRSDVKKIQEALEQLKNLYPFEIDQNKLVIKPTDEKGVYDVYISKFEVVQERDYKKIIITATSFIIAFVICFILICNKIHDNNEYVLQQKQIEAQKLEDEKKVRVKEEKLASLQKEYQTLISQGYDKVFPRIERIYSVMSKGTVIENMSIDKSNFTVEVTTKDALGILNAFEKSSLFCNVKMNRTTVKNNFEFVTYSGEFPVSAKQPDVDYSIDEKILYFENEINQLNARKLEQQSKQLSDYINQIRNYLHKNGCNEQYIQLHTIDKVSEVELFVLSSSKSILNFLEQIQKDENNLFDIKQLRIRNSEDSSRITTTVCFKSWILEGKNSELTDEYKDKEIPVAELDKLFYKKAAVVPVARTYVQPVVSRTVKPTAVKLKSLTYVGMSKLNGSTFIVVKDDSMGSIYKLPLCSSEISGNCCIEGNGNYTAKIRNEYYEVKK